MQQIQKFKNLGSEGLDPSGPSELLDLITNKAIEERTKKLREDIT